MTGWGRDTAYTMGDVHYWGVWWGEEPFEMYRKKIGRFVSEYGFQGMPPIETIESFTGSTIHSTPNTQHSTPDVLEAHQKHPRGTELIQKYMERDFIVPENFEDYVYLSQVLQAEGMGQAFYTHRIAQPYCMGTLYWQLNDCWPVTSWAGLDYYGRWKALHYHVKRAFAPLMIRAVEFDGKIFVFALNDHPSGQEIDFKFSLQDFEGKAISETEKTLEMLPQSKMQIFSMPAPADGLENVVFVARLYKDKKELSNTFLYFLPTKSLNLPVPGITFEIESSEAGLMVIVHAEKMARQVFLEAKGLEGRFDDNFFDMAAGETREVRFKGKATASELSDVLKIKSIYETYR
jgi:beta-mannosidase